MPWAPRWLRDRKAIHSPALGSGAGQRAVELFSLASDGAGHLVAVGATLDDGTAVIVRGDGTTFTTSSFDGSLSAVWFADVGQAWATGAGGCRAGSGTRIGSCTSGAFAGAVGGVAAVLLFERHPRLELLAVAALVGTVMAVLGVFRLIAQGL